MPLHEPGPGPETPVSRNQKGENSGLSLMCTQGGKVQSQKRCPSPSVPPQKGQGTASPLILLKRNPLQTPPARVALTKAPCLFTEHGKSEGASKSPPCHKQGNSHQPHESPPFYGDWQKQYFAKLSKWNPCKPAWG